jgi:DNA processing protein
MRTTALIKDMDITGRQSPSSNGYDVIGRGDVLYPKKLLDVLGSKAPQHIYYKGNLAILADKSVGFCGSRNASEKGLETAQDCSTQIASEWIAVISGYAAGVDLRAHRAALEAGGHTIFVLPEGIEHFRIKKELKDVWDWSRVLVISQFEPSATWQAFRAMDRNNVIVALSDAMIVIEAGEKGGTIEAGRSALRLKRPLFVAEYEDMANALGNNELLKKGAKRLRRSSLSNRASLKSLLSEIANPNTTTSPEPVQSTLL